MLSIYPYFISLTHSLSELEVCVFFARAVFSAQPRSTRSCQFPAEFNQFMCHYPIVYQISGRHPIIHAVVMQFIHFVCLSLLLLRRQRLLLGLLLMLMMISHTTPSMCRFLCDLRLSLIFSLPFSSMVVVCLTFQLYIDSSWDCCQCSSNIYCQFHIYFF